MTDVFEAMQAHVDAVTELLTANEIESKAQSDLDKARDWLTSCQEAAMTARKKEKESGILLRSAVNFRRLKATPKTGE